MGGIAGADIRKMRCVVYRGEEEEQCPEDLSAISDILADPGVLVWFDLVAPQMENLALIQEEFGLHPLAVEDAVKAHQRPKIEAYDGYWFIVVHGVKLTSRITIHEVAIFVGRNFVVTVRADPAYPLDEIEQRWRIRGKRGVRSGMLLYTILDAVVDGYSPVAEHYEKRVEAFEAALLSPHPRKREVLLEVFTMKKEIQSFRRAVVPMRELLVPLMRGDVDLLSQEDMPYYRDVYDHTVRVIDYMDAARDLVASALDIQLSLASNRQSDITKQLTIIATIFLPLSYITGFFGQNFAFLVDGIKSPKAFFSLGIGCEVLAFAALLAYFQYKRWF